MPVRLLREGILTSERVNALECDEEVFYRRLMSVVDDWGRFSAKPMLLRAALYPLKLDSVSDADMDRLLIAVQNAGLAIIYEVSGKKYLELIDFNQQIRAKSSKYPTPISNDKQLQSICKATVNQMNSDDKQPLATAHLDGGGIEGGVGDVDEIVDDTHPPTREANEKFSMFAKWKPSGHLPQMIRQAGLLSAEPQQLDIALTEFIGYWLTKSTSRTQHEWDHALLKSLKSDDIKAKSQPPPAARKGQKFDPVAHVNRNRTDT